MILPGDVLWDRYRVAAVEPERAGRAWLEDVTVAGAGPLLFLQLNEHDSDAFKELFALLSHNLVKRSGAPESLKFDFFGTAEFRGEPGVEGGSALVALPARENLAEQLAREGPISAGETVEILQRLLQSLLQLQTACQRNYAGIELHILLTKLLNPLTLGFAADGSRRLGLCAPRPAQAANGEAKFIPPLWTRYAAPEVLRGELAMERSVIFNIGSLARAMLIGPEPKPHDMTLCTRFAEDVLGKRDASKEFLSEEASAKIPEELREVIAKCLKPKQVSRYVSLQRVRNALPDTAESWFDEKRSSKSTPAHMLAPKRDLPAGMALVEAGSFLAGEKKIPRTLRAFAIDIKPVTERAYKQYLQEVHRQPRQNGPGTRPAKFDEHPVVNVTWREAEEFAEHAGKRLPTIHEWEKAARGVDGRKYPYGDTYLGATGRLRVSGSKESQKTTSPVGSFPLGASPYGALDMAGNVLEWTSTGRRQGQRMFRALKGACYLDGSPELSRCAGMQYKPAEAAEGYVGFRCVKDVD